MPDPRDEAQTKIIVMAMTNPAFRKLLLSDPAAAIAKATGVKIGSAVTVKVVEDTEDLVHLVLPAAPPEAKPAGPSDKELSGVAGGEPSSTQAGYCAASSAYLPERVCR